MFDCVPDFKHQAVTVKAVAMATLSLPKPVNTYAGEDELRSKPNANVNGNGTPNGTDGMEEEDPGLGGEYRPPRASDRFKKGIIYPPKEIRGKPYDP